MSRRMLPRRRFLRGLLQGSACTVALPLLDVFLNPNASALASGRPLPLRFGTWFWGCGVTPNRWNPSKAGRDWEITTELQALAPHRDVLCILSGFNMLLDGSPNQVHSSGVVGTLTGNAPSVPDEFASPSLDVLIGDAIGTSSRFRSIELAADGDPRHSYSRRNTSATNPAEISPLALYRRLFGPEFVDPNAATFTPDPKVMLRRSVLSVVKQDRESLVQKLGSHDRARLDDYFTSVRQMERQLELMLQAPEPLAGCAVPAEPADAPVGTEIGTVEATHRALAQLLAMALACDQTRVFNAVFSYGASQLRKAGSNMAHHQLTHEEPVDPALGYQPEATYFVERSMQALAEFIGILKGMPEGDGCLLDNCLVLAHSEVSLAKNHDVAGLPLMLAGKAGGRLRTGIHVQGNGDPVSRVGLTLQQLAGVPVERWGTRSMQTTKTLSEIIA